MIRVWFMTTFVSCILAAGIITRFVHWLVFLPQLQRQRISAQVAGLCFRMIFKLNPQISVENVGSSEPAWDELFSDPKVSPIVLINHTSPLDSIFYSMCVPISEIQHLRTLAKSSLFSMPMLVPS